MGDDIDPEPGDELMWCPECEKWWPHDHGAGNPMAVAEVRTVGEDGRPVGDNDG